MEDKTTNGNGAPAYAAEALFADYLALVESGGAADFETWVASFPEVAEELRRLYRDSSRLDANLGAVAARSRRIGTPVHRGTEHEHAAPQAASAFQAPEVGGRIGDFKLVRRLAEGGMGQVWEARQLSLSRTVALKFIRPDRMTDVSVACFAREARAGGRLNHPNIVTVHAHGQAGGLHWIALEYVPGGLTLCDLIDATRRTRKRSSEDFTRMARFFLRLTDALQAAHDASVIHRDLKPQNILVTAEEQPKITDFGLARIEDESSVSTALGIKGTPLYMSPEQVSPQAIRVDKRTDVFSLGAILYEVLTLQRPFASASQAETYERIQHRDPPDPRVLERDVPEDLAIVCLKALEKRQQDRYQTMRAFGEDLRRFLANEPILARRPTAWKRARKWVRRHPTAVGGMALSGLFLLGGGLAVRGFRDSARAALHQEKANLVLQADYAIDEARVELAEGFMREYRALDAADPMPHLVLARGYAQVLRMADAKAELAAARELGHRFEAPEPHDARGQFLLGVDGYIRGEPGYLSKTIEAFERAITLDPLLRATYFPLYQVHKESGDSSAAERALSRFQGILATGDDYYELVGALRQELVAGKLDQALASMLDLQARVAPERAVELRLERNLGRLHLARALEIGRSDAQALAAELDAAQASLEAALAAIPTDVASWANLGMVALARYTFQRGSPGAEGALERVLECGRRAIAERRQDPVGHRLVLNALVMLADRSFNPSNPDRAALEEALGVADELRALDPAHPSLDLMAAKAHLLLGLAADAGGDEADALQRFRLSVDLDPNQVLPRLRLAQAAFGSEDWEEAIEELERARDALERYGAELRVPPALAAAVHIWTFGVAGKLERSDADALGERARQGVDEALAAGAQISPIELLNYAEFLASSPSDRLRDCAESGRVYERFHLDEFFLGGPHEESARQVEALIQACR
jgi:serine/threonine protein kinase